MVLFLLPAGSRPGALVGICARLRSNFLLLRQKKVTKEKASRIRRPFGHTALLGPSGKRRNSPCGLKHLRFFFRSSLRYSPPHYGGSPNSQSPNSRVQIGTRHGASRLKLVLVLVFVFGVWYSVSNAVMRRRVAQGWTDQGWRCPSEASLARPRPDRATQCARAAGRRIRLAFSLVTFFWRSKRKLLRSRAHIPTNAPGARPGRHRKQNKSEKLDSNGAVGRTSRHPPARRLTRP